MREYFYDATSLGVHEDNAMKIMRKDDDSYDYYRYDIPSDKWVPDYEYSGKVLQGQREPELMTKNKALERIEEIKKLYKQGKISFNL